MNLSLTVIGAGEFKSLVADVPSTYFLRLRGPDGTTADLEVSEEQLGLVLDFAAGGAEEAPAEPVPARPTVVPPAPAPPAGQAAPNEEDPEDSTPLRLRALRKPPGAPVVTPFAGGDDL